MSCFRLDSSHVLLHLFLDESTSIVHSGPRCAEPQACVSTPDELRAGNEEEARAFLLPFPDGSLCLCCELPYRRRPHWSRLDALCKGDVSTGPCFNFPMPRAGIPGSWAYLTWLSVTWHQLPSYTFPLFPLRPTA